jgi:hypothetical protein
MRFNTCCTLAMLAALIPVSYLVVEQVNAAPRGAIKSSGPIERPPAGRALSGRHEIHGPFAISSEEIRALLASPPKETTISEPDNEGDYENEPSGVRRVTITDRKLRAAAEGQSSPQVPGPPGPGNPPIQTPAPSISWQANGMSQGSPPDPQIAVSKSHVVVATQRALGFFQKDGTSLGTPLDYETFFKGLGLATATDATQGLPSFVGSDPRLIFDAYRNVFWLVKTGAGAGANPPTNNARSIVYVAVSTSDNPLGDPANPQKPAWNLYWWDSVVEWHVPNSTIYQLGDIADYPAIGIDPVAFHQTIAVCNRVDTSQKNTPCNARYAVLVTAPAQDLVDGINPNAQYFGSYFIFIDPNQKLMTGVVQPTVHHGPTGGYAYYVARSRSSNSQLLVWRIKPPAPGQPVQQTAVPRTVTMMAPFAAFSSPPDAPQCCGSAPKIVMSNLGTDVLKSVYRSGLLHIVTNDARQWSSAPPSLTSIHMVRFSVQEWPSIPTTGKFYINRVFGYRNVIDDKENDRMYYGWPAIEVNKNFDMVIVYARSGETIFTEARISARYNNESDIRPSRLLHKGEATIAGAKAVRWGDLAGASVDPEDDTSIWVVHQYATDAMATKSYYGIWVGKITP